jgi:REP element-mobilizing transposase RayT
MLRGNAGQDIFIASDDRRRIYDLLAEGTERFGHRVHGFCLMSNHIHLVVQLGEVALSRPMQNLAFRYAQGFNRRHGRGGHLFQSRFKAILVDADSYLLELVRYVHLNPVRAGLVRHPEDYPWSGHRAYLGEETLPWLTTDWILGQFDRRLARARSLYRDFLRDGEGEGRRDDFHWGSDGDPRVLADDDYLQGLAPPAEYPAVRPDLEQLVAGVAALYGVRPAALAGPSRARHLAEARAIVAWLARESGVATMAEAAVRFGRDASALSHALRRIDRRRLDDVDFAEHLAELYRATIQTIQA